MKVDQLTTVEANAICVYADRCLKVLNMRHWAVHLGADPCQDNAVASINPTDGRYVALIHVSADWSERDVSVKRSTIMHECLHLLHAQVDDHLRNVLKDNTQISEDLWHAVYTPFCTNLEYMVDHLTSVLRKQDLLPRWPTDKQVRRYMQRYRIVDDELVDHA